MAWVSECSPVPRSSKVLSLSWHTQECVLAFLGDADLAKSRGGGWPTEALELLNCLLSGTFVFIIQRFLRVP